MMRSSLLPAVVLALLVAAPALRAQEGFGDVAKDVNKKCVKLFGSGGFRGVNSYGTGLLVSPDGHILTVASSLLDTQDLRVHLYDGRRFQAKLIVVEPELDLALCKIDKEVRDLSYFNITEAAKKPLAETGDWILGFSNQFQIATRDEPMSIQRGCIAAFAKLQGRRGIFDAAYQGEVYVIDAITNNPGAGGGVVTTRKGEFLGIIGKELRNTLTDTWINYAIPAQAKAEVRRGDKTEPVTLAQFVELAIANKYIAGDRKTKGTSKGGFHGIILVPNVVERTPPFVDEVMPKSPAALAGLKPDDLIVYVEGEQVVSVKAFRELMDTFGPKDKVRIEVRRGEKLQTITVELTEQPKK